jgi:hypothetical protein
LYFLLGEMIIIISVLLGHLLGSDIDDSDFAELLAGWERNNFNAPEQVVAQCMLEEGIRVSLETLNANVNIGFPETSWAEVEEIQQTLIRSMVIPRNIHDHLFEHFTTVILPTEDECRVVAGHLVSRVHENQQELVFKRALNMIKVWVKYCIIPIRKGFPTCYPQRVPNRRVGRPAYDVWLLTGDAQREYLTDLIRGRT